MPVSEPLQDIIALSGAIRSVLVEADRLGLARVGIHLDAALIAIAGNLPEGTIEPVRFQGVADLQPNLRSDELGPA